MFRSFPRSIFGRYRSLLGSVGTAATQYDDVMLNSSTFASLLGVFSLRFILTFATAEPLAPRSCLDIDTWERKLAVVITCPSDICAIVTYPPTIRTASVVACNHAFVTSLFADAIGL